jgi:hypothetical protein
LALFLGELNLTFWHDGVPECSLPNLPESVSPCKINVVDYYPLL